MDAIERMRKFPVDSLPRFKPRYRKLWEAWLEALRSDRYQQGQETLMVEGDDDTNSYCCLGVLVDVAEHLGYDCQSDLYSDAELVSDDVYDWWAVDEGENASKPQAPLALRNDSGWTFSQLADAIETHMAPEGG